jgi:aquaporin Z
MNVKAMVAELVGTFALIFIGVGAIAVDFMMGGTGGLVGIALAHGLTIAVMVSAATPTSGGHLNPAVTVGAWITGKLNSPNAAGYITAQCAGAVLAAALVKLALPASALAAVNMGTPAVNTAAGVTLGMALVAEIVLTFFLMFVVYATAIDRRASGPGGLFIGLTVTLDILFGGPVSGAAMNPARHLGPALLGGGTENLWLYWVGPLLGASLAALLYHHVLEEKGA